MSVQTADSLLSVDLRLDLCKQVDIPEFTEMAAREVLFGRLLVMASRLSAAEALSDAVDRIEQRKLRPVAEAEAAEAMIDFSRRYNAAFADRSARILRRVVAPIVALGKSAAWRRLTGVRRSPLIYEFAKALPGLRHVEPMFGVFDDDEVRRLRAFGTSWLDSHYERLVAASLHDLVRSAFREEGAPTGLGFGRRFREIVRREFELSAVPDTTPKAWRGPKAHFEMSAAALTTTARALGTLRAAEDLGASFLTFRTAADERVCPQCSAMDGRKFPAEAIWQRREELLDRRPEDGTGWRSEAEFLQELREADLTAEPQVDLTDRGLAVIPVHPLCRCTWDPSPPLSLGRDANPVSAAVRTAVAERAVGRATDDLTALQRDTLLEGVAGIAPWLDDMPLPQWSTGAALPAFGLPPRLAIALDGVFRHGMVFTTFDALDAAASGDFHPVHYALAKHGASVVAPFAGRAFDAATAAGRATFPSAVTAEEFLALGMEAYQERSRVGRLLDRDGLRRAEPGLVALLDIAIQRRRRPTEAEVAEALARVPEVPSAGLSVLDGERRLLLTQAVRAESRKEFAAVAEALAATFAEGADASEIRPWARAAAALAIAQGLAEA